MFANRKTWVAVVALVLVCAALVLARFLMPAGVAAADFTLTDQDGHPFTLSAQRGHPIALFFGYAHCPDVCPTTLSALSVAKRKLGPAGEGFDVVLVTVDPARDNPAVLKRYVRLFNPSFVGLTGTETQLDPVYAAYHVYHQVDPGKGSANGYGVAHSSAVQFISPDGRLRGVGDWSDSPDELAVLMKAAQS
jgi:protein SCO1/2